MKTRPLIVLFLVTCSNLIPSFSEPAPFDTNLFDLEPIYELRTDYSEEARARGIKVLNGLKKHQETPISWRTIIELGIAFKRQKNYSEALSCFELVGENSIKLNAYDWTADAYDNIADLYRWQNDLKQSLEYCLKALHYSQKSEDLNMISEAHHSIGKTQERLSNYEKAISAYKQSIATSPNTPSPNYLGKSHLYIARIYKKLSNLEETLNYARLASKYLSNGGKQSDLRNCYEIMSYSQIRLGQYGKALESASLGLGSVAKSEIHGDEIVLLGYLSTIYRKIGFYDQALKHGLEALDIAEKTEDPNNIATAALQLAVIHETLGNLEETPLYLNRVFELKDLIKSKYTASALKTLSRVYSQNSNFEAALKTATQSFDLYTNMGDKSGMAGSLFNMAEIYKQMGNEAAAIENYNSSLKHYDLTSDRYGRSNSLIQLGPIYFDNGEKDKGISLIKRGIIEAEESTANTLLIDGYKKLFNLMRRNGQEAEAADYAQKYIELQESILNAESLSRISNLQFISRIDQKQKEINKLRSERIINNLELERNAQEIELLNGKRELQEMQLSKSKSTRLILLFSILFIATLLLLSIVRYRYLKRIKQTLQEKNEAIKRSNTQLQEVNKSKDQFFAMIAHDLKNSIGNLTSCIQFVNTENFTPKSKDATTLLSSLTRSATDSHQLLLNLLQWAKMQMSIIELKEQPVLLIETIDATNEVFSNSLQNKELSLEVLIDNRIIVYTDENVLKTILRNLLHNAIKFSHRGGRIVISAKKKNGSLELSITDQGVGLPKDFQSKVAGSKKFLHGSGTEGEMGSGIGIAVCNWLLKLSDNQLNFSGTEKGGALVSFNIQLFVPKETEQVVSTKSAGIR